MQKCNKKFLVIFLFIFSTTFLFISCAPKKPTLVKPQVDEATIKPEEEARLKPEEETRLKAKEEAKRKPEEEARLKPEEETRLKAEEEAKRRAEEKAKRKIYEEAKLRAKEEARRKAEEEARLKAEGERKKIEEEKLSATTETEAQPLTARETEVRTAPAEERLSATTTETEAQPLAARETEVRTAPALEDIYFDFNKSDIRTDGREILQRNAEWLQKNPNAKIQIEGHCDERGTTEYNLALGERRAISVKKYLISLGISAERLYTISYGEELPINPGHNEEAWVKNRRGHFLIIIKP